MKSAMQIARLGCFHCNSRQNLKKCSCCSRVTYCSKECQMQDWTKGKHKTICRIWTTRPQLPIDTNLPASLAMTLPDLRWQLFVQSQARLPTVWTIAEAEKIFPPLLQRLFEHEPRCAACIRPAESTLLGPNSLDYCPDCLIFGLCSPSSSPRCSADLTDHKSSGACKKFSLVVSIFEDLWSLGKHFEEILADPRAYWTPKRVLLEPSPLSSSWEEYFAATSYQRNSDDPLRVFIDQEHLSPSLTILGALNRFYLKLFSDPAVSSGDQKKRILTIHVVGAHQRYELCKSSDIFEEILHHLPSVNILQVVFIGPDVPEPENWDMACDGCSSQGRKFILECHKELYENYRQRNPVPPALAVCFDAGIHSPKYYPMWVPALKLLLEAPNSTPTIITTFSEETARLTYERLQGIGFDAKVKWFTEENIWAGGLWNLNPVLRRGVFARNAFWMGLGGKRE